jgi:branched-chain amino acid transport system substrate-binding protein
LATKISRRKFLAASGAIAAIAKVARPAVAQQNPVKIGLITVKTGGLAAGGVHLEEGIACFLKDKNFTLAGRKIELVVADTAGVPATAKAKAIELVERDKVDLIMGPLAAFEWLAIKDYLGEHKMPTVGFGGAEDLAQRHRDPYQVRTSDSSAQCLYPLADYASKEMKLKAAITAGDDFAFGYEQVGGFQSVFEDDGGRVIKKLWSPFNTPDYVPYLAQIDPRGPTLSAAPMVRLLSQADGRCCPENERYGACNPLNGFRTGCERRRQSAGRSSRSACAHFVATGPQQQSRSKRVF